jgi:7,8-dihydropterin-6-yl-methyl-4-(beta-D-ribofuranosyl)aminobenzene 5'-phosphate synthase
LLRIEIGILDMLGFIKGGAMKSRKIAFAFLGMLLLIPTACSGDVLLAQLPTTVPGETPVASPTFASIAAAASPSAPSQDELTITVVYDNYLRDERLTAAWGFAAWVEHAGRKVLFDTGGDGVILMQNMLDLGINPRQAEVLVLSHEHGDHIGGVEGLLRFGARPVVYVPPSFSRSFKAQIAETVELVEVQPGMQVSPNMISTGELSAGGGLTEQGLVIQTAHGLIVITGCAHPGVVRMVQKATDLLGGPVLLVMGGFHLGQASSAQVASILESFRELDVRNVSPSHCTGDMAISMFADAYGSHYWPGGVGLVLSLQDLAR